MVLKEFIRKQVTKHPELKNKLKSAGMNITPFQYVFQTYAMTTMTIVGLTVVVGIFFQNNPLYLLGAIAILLLAIMPFMFTVFFQLADSKAKKLGQELDGDILFISEYLLVVLESGIPLPNALTQLAKVKRPGGIFFDRVMRDFKLGKSLEQTLGDATQYCPSESLRILIKRLKDSLDIGVDLEQTLANFVEEGADKKLVEIKGYEKKVNPKVMMYLIFGIVIPSLGVTFLILGAALSGMEAPLLRVVLGGVFTFMFMYQFMAYSSFKAMKSSV